MAHGWRERGKFRGLGRQLEALRAEISRLGHEHIPRALWPLLLLDAMARAPLGSGKLPRCRLDAASLRRQRVTLSKLRRDASPADVLALELSPASLVDPRALGAAVARAVREGAAEHVAFLAARYGRRVIPDASRCEALLAGWREREEKRLGRLLARTLAAAVRAPIPPTTPGG